MFMVLLFVATAVVGSYLFASGAVTAAIGVSAVFDRLAQKRSLEAPSAFAENAGVLLLMFGVVFRATDPFHAYHAMIVGGLLLALGALIRPEETRAAADPLLSRVQVAQYGAALVCVATLAIFKITAALV